MRTDDLKVHLQSILGAGKAMSGISRASGVSETVINRIILDQKPIVQREIADKLLAIKAEDVEDGKLGLDATGTRRRLQAMAADGYPMHFICQELNTRNASRLMALRNGRITTLGTDFLGRIKDLHERLRGKPGPDAAVRATALHVKGWLPSSAWEGVDIDDPDASPRGCADA